MPTNQHQALGARHHQRRKGLRRPRQQKSPLRLSLKTARRLAELDDVLGIIGGQGVADLVLSHLTQEIIHEAAAGQSHAILDNWCWKDRSGAEAGLMGLARRWAEEDGLEREAAAE